MQVDLWELVAVVLGSVLIGVGILLVVAGFIITNVVQTKPTPPGPAPHANIWDFIVELAKRVQLIYVPGLLMIALGIVLIAMAMFGAGVLGTPGPTPGSGVTPAPS